MTFPTLDSEAKDGVPVRIGSRRPWWSATRQVELQSKVSVNGKYPLMSDKSFHAHVACIACWYDVFQLRVAAACPECGTTLEKTLRHQFLFLVPLSSLVFLHAALVLWIFYLAGSVVWTLSFALILSAEGQFVGITFLTLIGILSQIMFSFSCLYLFCWGIQKAVLLILPVTSLVAGISNIEIAAKTLGLSVPTFFQSTSPMFGVVSASVALIGFHLMLALVMRRTANRFAMHCAIFGCVFLALTVLAGAYGNNERWQPFFLLLALSVFTSVTTSWSASHSIRKVVKWRRQLPSPRTV